MPTAIIFGKHHTEDVITESIKNVRHDFNLNNRCYMYNRCVKIMPDIKVYKDATMWYSGQNLFQAGSAVALAQ